MMTRRLLGAVAISAALALSACNAADNGAKGGEPERQLAAATVAADVGTVKRLLAAGADPNKMAPYEGHYQSPWKLALHQVRPGRADLLEIIQAMLKAGASPTVAWGQAPSLRSGGYTTQRHAPMSDAVLYSAPDVARALMAAGLGPRFAETDLILAIENGQAEIVHVLVEAGVDVNSHRASTPLVAAIDARNLALMTYLEEHGAREKP
jgi:hypothetical protein